MHKKKSYMNRNSILNEGFFDKLSKFLKTRPNVSGKNKIGILKKLKMAISVSGLNGSVAKMEALSRKLHDDDSIELPRFSAKDFIK